MYILAVSFAPPVSDDEEDLIGALKLVPWSSLTPGNYIAADGSLSVKAEFEVESVNYGTAKAVGW